MRILLLAAMSKELELLSTILQNPDHKVEKTLITGEIAGHDIIIARCGIGKVNAALYCQRLITGYNPDLVINSGVAGGAGLPVGSLLVADRVAYYDVWCGPGTKYGEADGFPLFMLPSAKILENSRKTLNNAFYGLICTGDKFITTSEEIAFIRSHFPDVKAVDMESAAIAQTCILNNIQFAVIRVVSDTPGEAENISQYNNFWEKAPLKTFESIKLILSSL